MIAIGIPTVVEAATIVYDSMSTLIDELAHAESLQTVKKILGEIDGSRASESDPGTVISAVKSYVCDTKGH